MADIPGVYANVSKALCFIDYATKCVLGQDADYYGLTGCDDWAKTKYCDLKSEIEDLEALVSSINIYQGSKLPNSLLQILSNYKSSSFNLHCA